MEQKGHERRQQEKVLWPKKKVREVHLRQIAELELELCKRIVSYSDCAGLRYARTMSTVQRTEHTCSVLTTVGPDLQIGPKPPPPSLCYYPQKAVLLHAQSLKYSCART